MTWTLHNTDCLSGLRQLPDNHVQTCVTSPPYWGLRDYGVDGQLGLEPTPEEYVAKMVDVFREVRRVLRDDGTLWLNLGDSYASNVKGSGGAGKSTLGPNRDLQNIQFQKFTPRKFEHGLKPKDLVGIPWRVAFALQADGWYLRSDIIWHKPNPMPESVKDRPTKAHEYIFLLTKSARYYYDSLAIQEPLKEVSVNRYKYNYGGNKNERLKATDKPTAFVGRRDVPAGRNKRDVWTVSAQPFREAHFATFPPKLIEPCILAGSSPGDLVLDPFAGAGTTMLVAEQLGRDSIGFELNPQYCEIVKHRLGA